MTEPVIAVDALEKSYGSVRAVDAISFEVAAGEIFGVVGPNGAGKTTTIECLEGLRAPDGGRVVDPAALLGLFRRVRDLGMPLVSISPVEQGPPTTLGTEPGRCVSRMRLVSRVQERCGE
jgi:energy-coupling factor transporter ATP-binding protein EcfA2